MHANFSWALDYATVLDEWLHRSGATIERCDAKQHTPIASTKMLHTSAKLTDGQKLHIVLFMGHDYVPVLVTEERGYGCMT